MKYELVHDDTIEYDGHKLTRLRILPSFALLVPSSVTE